MMMPTLPFMRLPPSLLSCRASTCSSTPRRTSIAVLVPSDCLYWAILSSLSKASIHAFHTRRLFNMCGCPTLHLPSTAS